MKTPNIDRLALISVAAVSLCGCALLPHHHSTTAKIRPAPTTPSAPQSLVDDGVYADAVASISRRDYASALDLLQAARTRNPNDARVLNAFGVVYDKLGRFDLSPRYYAQAEALDPGSPIVANNRAYSLLMQSRKTSTIALAQVGPIPKPLAAPGSVAPARVAAAPAVRPQGAEYALATAGADLKTGKVGTP